MKILTIKFSINFTKTLLIACILVFSCACNKQEKKSANDLTPKTALWIMGEEVAEIEGEIRGISQDSKHNLWFASNGNGVYKYDGNRIVRFTEKHGFPSDYVWMVKEGKEGKIWFKTNTLPKDVQEICCFDGTEFKKIMADTTAIQYDFRKGELIFNYYYDGKSLYKIQLPHNSPIKNELNKKHHYDIYASCLDKNGNVWFGTATAGICRYDGKNYQWFDDAETLGCAIRSIFEDQNGVLWAGNNGVGLLRYDGKKFINFSKEKKVHNPDFEKYPVGKPGFMSRVWSITDDAMGDLWIGTIDNGVWRFDGKTLKNYTTKEGLSIAGLGVWIIYKDKEGKLWFGTEGDGVYHFDGKKFVKFKSERL